MTSKTILRIARPTDHLKALTQQYELGLGLTRLGSFSDHEGYDGVILGHPNHPWHLEFTQHAGKVAGRAPTKENLLVLYFKNAAYWRTQCHQMQEAGFMEVQSSNPYWDHTGTTFEDVDGYRVVLQQSQWEA